MRRLKHSSELKRHIQFENWRVHWEFNDSRCEDRKKHAKKEWNKKKEQAEKVERKMETAENMMNRINDSLIIIFGRLC